jgi:hypothetical protein
MIRVSAHCVDATITENDRAAVADGSSHEPIVTLCSRPRRPKAMGRRKPGPSDQNQLIYVTQDEKESLKGSWLLLA